MDRTSLTEAELAGLLRGDLWRRIDLLAETGSTNADLARAARDGEAEGLVLVAEHQTAGRGRLDRSWEAPAASGLTFSVLLRPESVDDRRWGWLPLAAGVAAATAVEEVAGVGARLKWPNDLLAGTEEGKLAGILSERVETPDGPAAVIGIGLNVTMREEELPVPNATSLLLAGGTSTDRVQLLGAILDGIERWYQAWRAAGGDADSCGLRQEYASRCATLGRSVRVQLPGEESVTGTAREIDADGALGVTTESGEVTVAAGDVVHVE